MSAGVPGRERGGPGRGTRLDARHRERSGNLGLSLARQA